MTLLGDYSQIPAFCINLDRRADRWALAEPEFARLAWPVTRWRAVEHKKSPYNGLRPAQAACLDSHKQLWRHALAQNYPAIAVFEDDVVFSSDFKDIFAAAAAQLPADWDVWHLHSTHAALKPVSALLVQLVGPMWGTHGYLISRQGCEKALALADTDPVDYRISGTLHRKAGKVYGLRMSAALAFQRGEPDSDIPATGQSGFYKQQRERFCR